MENRNKSLQCQLVSSNIFLLFINFDMIYVLFQTETKRLQDSSKNNVNSENVALASEKVKIWINFITVNTD